MKQALTFGSGLHTSNNPHSVPEGALEEAVNVKVNNVGVLEKRDGFKSVLEVRKPDSVLGIGDSVLGIGDSVLGIRERGFVNKVNYLSSIGNTLYVFGNDGRVYKGEEPPRLLERGYIFKKDFQAVEFQNSLFFNSEEEVKQVKNDKVYPAGIIPFPNFRYEFRDVEDGINLKNGKERAFRCLFYSKDLFLEGTPSSRVLIKNNSGSDVSVNIEFFVPRYIFINYDSVEVRVYATEEQNIDEDLTGDDMFFIDALLLEKEETKFTIQDNTDRERRLYTNGGLGARVNDFPPNCRSMVSYKGYLCYANVEKDWSMDINYTQFLKNITTGLNNGIVEARFSSDVGFRKDLEASTIKTLERTRTSFYIPDSLNEQEQAIFCANFINYGKDTPNNLYAYFLPSLEEQDQILRVFFKGGSNFAPSLVGIDEKGIAYINALGGVNGKITFTKDYDSSRLFISNLHFGEQVPPANFIDIGARDKSIKGLVEYRDRLYIFKEDGVFVMNGNSFDSFIVQEFLREIILIEQKTLKVLEEYIFCLSSHGLVAIHTSGFTKISNAVNDFFEKEIKDAVSYVDYRNRQYVITLHYEKGDSRTFSFSVEFKTWFESDRVAIDYHEISDNYFLVEENRVSCFRRNTEDKTDETYPLKAYKMNERGFEYPDSKKVFYLSKETSYSIEIGSFIGSILSNARVLEMSFGKGRIKVVLDEEININEDDFSLIRSIPIAVTSKRIFMGDLSVIKIANDFYCYFKDFNTENVDVAFTTNQRNSRVYDKVPLSISEGWGTNPWGDGAWGGIKSTDAEIRIYPPLEKAQFSWIRVHFKNNKPFSNLKFLNAIQNYETINEKQLFNV